VIGAAVCCVRPFVPEDQNSVTEIESTFAVLLTPPGRGAVASLLLEGPGCCEALARCFTPVSGRAAASLPVDRIVLGRWTAPPAAGEEVVVARRGGQRIEIHCHGGDAVSRAMLASLIERGCRTRCWTEVLPLVDLHHVGAPRNDSIAVEARLALAKASTETAAAVLLDQWRGALRREVESLRCLLAGAATDAELQTAHSRLAALRESGRLGLHLTEPFRVVLAGRPNVGKSSLVNALLGYSRALVYDMPGTTRDVVTAHTAIDGWPVELSDTAGLRCGAAALESLGIERAREQIAAADLTVLVLDASEPPADDDRRLLTAIANPLVVFNKCDLAAVPDDARPQGLAVSALTGAGVERLLEDIARRLVPNVPAAGDPVPFTMRQLDLLQAAHDALHHDRLEVARETLGQL
jgi:tRNA modification GTPase